MRRSNVNKYISLEASEDESDVTSEDIDDLTILEERPIPRIPRFLTEDLPPEDEYSESSIEQTDEDLMQSQLIPQPSSPRLFIVRVKRGAERDIALKIIHNRPNVCSIVCKNGLKGYIYIEAYHKQQVLDALGRLRGINKTKISIVPQTEMIDAMTYKHDYKHIEFGRVKKGKYQGDLVQIIGAEGDMLRIRAVPRINGIKKLFNPEEFKNESVRKSKNCYIYNRDLYVNGFLEKDVLYNSIDFDIEPNFDELEQFDARKKLDVGDKVEVVKGELVGTKGVVANTYGTIVTIKAASEEYEHNINSLKKYYNEGEEVCYADQNGVITKIEGDTYYIAINNFTEEAKVSIDDLKPPRPQIKIIRKADRVRQVFKRDRLVNKVVQIKKGAFKGYIGTVKDVYMNKCRVQIESNLKCVTVPKEDVVEVNRKSKEWGSGSTATSENGENATTYQTITDRDSVIDFSEAKSMGKDLRAFHEISSVGTLSNSVKSSSAYKGTMVIVNGSHHILHDIKDGMYVTNYGIYDRDAIGVVHPSKNDNVCILFGENSGKSGIVLDVKNDRATIKMIDGPIKSISLGNVSRRAY